jgi:hypothetical protein
LLEIEVKPRQVLRRLGSDDRQPLEPVGSRVIREAEVVVLSVVAAVALEREVRIAEARCARLKRSVTLALVAVR